MPVLAAAFTLLAVVAGIVLGVTVTDPDVKPVVPLVPIVLAVAGLVLGIVGRQYRRGLALTSAVVSGIWALLWLAVMIAYLAKG